MQSLGWRNCLGFVKEQTSFEFQLWTNSSSFTELPAGFWHRALGTSVCVYLIINLKLTLGIAELKHSNTKNNNNKVNVKPL